MVGLPRNSCVAMVFAVSMALPLAAQAGSTINIAPYEPVVIELPINHGVGNAVQKGSPPPVPVSVRMPDGRTQSFVLLPEGILGTKTAPSGHDLTLWLIMNPARPRENIFVKPGAYQIEAHANPPSTVIVSVAQPSREETQVAELLKDNLLTSLSLTTNGSEINEATRTVCEKILKEAPFSRYAGYASAYLAVHRYYKSQQALDPEALIGKAAPDVASGAKDLVSDLRGIDPMVWPLRGMVLYFRGFGQATAGYTKGADPTLRTLTQEVQNNPWSRNAERLLTQIDREKVTADSEKATDRQERSRTTPLSGPVESPRTSPPPLKKLYAQSPRAERSSLSWGVILLIAAALVTASILIVRRKPPKMSAAVKCLAAILLLILVGALLFPVNPWERENSAKTQAMNDIQQLTYAVRAYRAEYGKYPILQDGGKVETAAQSTELMAILRGQSPKANPLNKAFIDLHGSRSGGAFTDAWGNHYRMRVDADEGGWVQSPYKDEPSQLPTDVIAWSVGEDGMQGRRGNPTTLNGSDDIVSWK